MPDSVGIVLAIVIAEILPGAIAFYAAYWAFSVRRALAGSLYRRHALFLGAVAILIALTGFLTYSTNQTISDGLTVFYSALFPFVFAFVDSTVPLARRSDPLLRSILHWDQVRIPLWGLAILLAGLNMLSAVSPSFASSPAGEVLGNIGWATIAIGLFGVSGAAIVIGARRSRDPVLQGNLKWLGLVLAVFVLIFVIDTAESFLFPNISSFDFYYSYYALPSGALAAIGAYFLYKSARSLAPMNHFLSFEPDLVPPVASGTG